MLGQARIINLDGDRQTAQCNINGVFSVAALIEPVDGADSEQTFLPTTQVVSLTSAGNITLSCGGFAIDADDVRLTAIKVDAIN